MKKVFVSIPMTGKSELEIMRTFDRIKKLVDIKYCGEEVAFVNDIHAPTADNTRDALINIGNSISKLADADLVVFSDLFQLSKGCVVEYACCNEYNIPYIFECKLLDEVLENVQYK